MSGIRLVVAALLATAAVEVSASASPADLSRTAIDSCTATLRQLAREAGRGALESFDLGRRCPALARDLEDLLGEADAPAVDVGAVSLEGVRDLAAIVDGFEPGAGVTRNVELDFDGLDALLDDVLIDEASEDSLWDRFLRWLEQHLRDEDSPRLGRFFDWLDDLDAPPWLGEVLIKTSTVLIVLLALIVVGNEVRLSGMPRRRRRERGERSAPAASAGTGHARAVSFDELRGLPARALAAAAVEMVRAAFAERGWVSPGESLTNGELVDQVGERESAAAPPFAALLKAVESILYGDRAPDDEARRKLIATTGALLAHCRRAPGPASRGTR